MLESLSKNETFEYKKLSPEEMSARGILGRLIGPCADFINPTRNGRGYGEELWEKVFDDPIVNEKIDNKCLFGELGHPADREEVDMEKISIALNEKPKKGKDGKLIACFDILDTPNGRILKTLCDYGTTIGISSRGTGEVIGDEVDPDSYNFECFDAVIVPAVKEARLNYVTESLNNNSLNLRRALCESLNSASEEDRKVMEKTLQELDIKVEDENKEDANLVEQLVEQEEHKSAESESPEQTIEKVDEAVNDGSDEIIKSLQEAIKDKSDLEAQVKQLQEQLAVSDAKVGKLEEELSGYKSTTVKMSKLAVENKDLTTKVSTLEEELNAKAKTIDSQKTRISKLVAEKKEGLKVEESSLNESLTQKDAEIKSLNENFNEIKADYEEQLKALNESIETLKSDSESKDRELNAKLDKETRLKESYKKLANKAVNRYIESKATMLGVKSSEIIGKLSDNYNFDDIDRVCEELQSYELNMNKLPFSVDRQVKVRVNKSINESLPSVEDDNDVDESLLRLAKLM